MSDESTVNVELAMSGPSYARSTLRWRSAYDPRPFTDEEMKLGRALRFVFISADEAWRYSICLDCDLPLPFHPAARRKRSRPKYCKIAQKAMLRVLDTRPGEGAEECC